MYIRLQLWENIKWVPHGHILAPEYSFSQNTVFHPGRIGRTKRPSTRESHIRSWQPKIVRAETPTLDQYQRALRTKKTTMTRPSAEYHLHSKRFISLTMSYYITGSRVGGVESLKATIIPFNHANDERERKARRTRPRKAAAWALERQSSEHWVLFL